MQIALTYQSELLPPRTIYLPDAGYRQLPPDDPLIAVGIPFVPVDAAAQAAEDAAIRQDLASLQAAAPPTRDI
jgi:hypothetical protein